jgi:hypothetical protein
MTTRNDIADFATEIVDHALFVTFRAMGNYDLKDPDGKPLDETNEWRQNLVDIIADDVRYALVRSPAYFENEYERYVKALGATDQPTGPEDKEAREVLGFPVE